MVGFVRSALVARGFAGSDPGRGHGTARQAMLRRCLTCHSWKDPQLKIHNCVPGGFGEKKEKKKSKGKEVVIPLKESLLPTTHPQCGLHGVRVQGTASALTAFREHSENDGAPL